MGQTSGGGKQREREGGGDGKQREREGGGGGKQWEEGSESLPAGWGRRMAGRQEFILAPLGGHQYKSRLSAFKDMVLKGYSVEEKQQMKAKLVEFEGWEESSLLPTNWLFKVVWEGSNKEGRWSENVSFLSCREGQSFESLRLAIQHMKTVGSYTEAEMAGCREFQAQQRRSNARCHLYNVQRTLT